VVEQIFFVPRKIQNQAPLVASGVPPTQSGQNPSVTTSEPSTRSRGSRKDSEKTRGQDPSNVVCADGGLADEARPGLDADPEHPDSYFEEGNEAGHEEYEGEYDEDEDEEDYEEDDEEDDEPDTINGLTFPPMDAAIQRASDGTISAEERAEAAMLMLGMAGGERLLFYITSLPLSDPRH